MSPQFDNSHARIPFGPRGDAYGAVIGGIGLTVVADSEEDAGFTGGSVGIELNLR